MEEFYEMNTTRHKPWKKALCILLSAIIAFGTFVALTVGSSRLQDWLGIQSMLSAYASEIVDTKGAIAVDEESMLADNHTINLENKDGSNTVYLFSEPISYTDENGNLKTKDISVEKQSDKALRSNGYEYTNGQNDYRINFSSDSSKGLYIEFGDSSYSIIPQSNNTAVGNKSTSEILSEQFEDFEYPNIYGEGTNLKFYPQLNGVKDEIVLNSNIGQNIFSFKLTTSNCTAVLNDDGTVSLISTDNKESVQTFSAPFAFDSEYVEGDRNEHYIDCSYTLDKIDDNTYIMSVNVDKSWLESENTVYPVTIDPTTVNVDTYRDAGIYSKYPNNSYGAEQTACIGRSSDYGNGRIYLQFFMPSEIKKGAKINSAFIWMRETTGRTSNMYVQPYLVKSSWNEGITWNNRAYMDNTSDMPTKNINSQSTDWASSPYWYKMFITSAVQKWTNGERTNYGIGLYSDEEEKSTYNWRAFATIQNSTSSNRPYTVINYTNDTTAPTITSVTGNPTAWTNSNVTLTVNGAKDENGGSGLHSSPYSFSTTKGSYSWQSSNNKTFSSNCTVYIYVRDVQGNIRLVSTQTINKIDKTKPSTPTVSGNATEWTTTPITLTASSSDTASGIRDYSFSTVNGSYSWQNENSKSFNENATVYVSARDNAGNISPVTEVVIDKFTTDFSYLIDPAFYKDGQLIGIYNPRVGKEKMQYKIGEDGEWTDYTVPFALPLNQEVTVFAKFESSQNADISGIFSSTVSSIGTYTESNTDFSLAYKNVSFDFTRSYDSADKKWFFATDSKVTVVNDYVISAVLPDSTDLTFIKTADNTYMNEINGYTLTKSENGYILQIDDVNYTYGTDGKLASISNRYDDTITIARTASSITITDGANRAYTLALDSNGNIISATDPANNVITYTYDNNNLTKVVDQAGVTLGQYSYTNGVLTKSMDKTIKYGTDGRVTSYEYDSGAFLNYTYDDENHTVSTESSTENTTSQKYNDALMVVSSTDEDGNTTEYTYDEYYRTLTETKDGKTVTYTYDSKGNVLSEVSDDEDAENTYYKYDENGNVVRQQTGKNYTYSVYNENNELVISATLKESYTGTIPEQYNADLDCFDTVTYTYENGILVKSVDSKTKETVTNTYDEYGNSVKVSTVTEKDDSSTVGVVDNTYDIMGNLLTSVSGEDTSSYIYDKAGRTLLANEKGDCTRTIYDSLGRTIQEISPEDYDSTKDGLPESNTYADAGAGQTYKYAANGTLTSETNSLGKTTKYFYNDIGSKVREEFDIYKFYYLNHGELYQVKVANVTTVSYSYSTDGKHLLLSETYANDEVIRYTYNDNGDVTAQYHNSNAKPYVTYTYNADNELTEKVNTDTGLKYVYSGEYKVDVYKTSDNTLVQSYFQEEFKDENANSNTEFDIDEDGNSYIISEGNPADGTKITETHFGISYSSFESNRSLKYTIGANTVEYNYTNKFKPDGSTEDRIYTDSVSYNNAVAISAKYTYDDKDNILSKSYGENNTIANTYDDKNRITSTSYLGKTYNYTYDNNSQLTAVSGNNYTANYAYDNRGNITSKTVNNETTNFTYANFGWKDLLVAINDVELTYDEIGNVLSYGDREFAWNSGRNLESIVDGNNNYSYTYDENGIRTSKTVNGVTTYYNTNVGVILSQTDGTNTMYFQYDTNGSPLGFIYNGTQYFYLTNQTSDVIGITDTTGTVVANYEYDAWGAEIGNDSSEIAQVNPIRYRGYYYDTETSYYYLQSRYYDTSICRFINADSAMFLDRYSGSDLNLFVYCQNHPINLFDFNGYKSKQGYYSPKAAERYAENWWNHYNPVFKTSNKEHDCANFVSQCLYAAGFPMTFKWRNTKVKTTYAWGKASYLYGYLREELSPKIYYIKKYSDVDVVGKILYSYDRCSALLFFDWTSNGGINHAALSGQVIRGGSRNRSYDIFYYAHSSSRRGTEYNKNKRNKYSLKQIYKNNYPKMTVYVMILPRSFKL